MNISWSAYGILCLLLLGLLPACSEKIERKAAAVSILKPCPGFVETGKPPLVYGAECGELTLKENPADANSKDISVAILRLPAISPVANADPLFLIQGGPGGSSIEMANQIHSFFADVRKNRDLIFVDQRGTGKSNPLRCEQASPEDLKLPEAKQTEKYIALMKNCAEKYQHNAAFYTTVDAVQDLDAVRIALGYEKINLWGGSYGTRVALEYARRYPEQARTIILDGVAPVSIALPKYFARDAMAALVAVNNECLAQTDCAAEFGNIVQKAETVLQRLNALQAKGEPLEISYEHPRNQQTESLHLTPRTFSSLIFMSLYSRDLTVLLPRAISFAEKEDYRLLAALSALSSENAQLMNIAEGMRYSVICNEDWPLLSVSDIEQSIPFFGIPFVKDIQPICALWPKAQLPVDYWDPIKSDVPALLLSGKHDPVTPDVWAQAVAAHLPNSTSLSAAGGNHSISSEGCVPQLIAQFIERASMKDVKADCVEKIKPLPLVLGANQKKAASSAADNYSSVGVSSVSVSSIDMSSSGSAE
ncbi:alpha/beta hydrolase [Cellvibrio fibrivorans]|uniref:Proline iminopeptidase n=1 Tax=Cellvibrio fibrivorans TaxID=126350 RepID=A0ABU1USJ1_9GAMM|nr:alpha/beta hydrolase [Cellvibrio fibrivorans]MDR7088149.1 pimeloyl-ACP methyl ester carboxylesterase [Cellvibrio fibrivorans]